MIKKYKRIKYFIKAIQWNGEDDEKLSSMFPAYIQKIEITKTYNKEKNKKKIFKLKITQKK